MAKIKCPKCKSLSVEMLGVKTRTKINLNPFRPFTLVNNVPAKTQVFRCSKCGKQFESRL